MSNIIEYGTSEFYLKTFMWSIKNIKRYRFYSGYCHCSDNFYFCGYFSYLVLKFYQLFNGSVLFKIHLYGQLDTSYKKNMSSHYSISMQNVNGQRFVMKSGEMQINAERFVFLLCENYVHNEFDQELASTICFSWSEDKRSASPSQAVQTEPEPESETYQFLDEMSNDFGSFFENKSDTDCVLSVGETKFPAHRSVLSARSTVFAAMFHHNTTESQTGEVVIEDVDPTALGDVLHFIYTGKVRGLSSDTAAPMYTVADKYALISLRDKCLDYLLCNLSVENLCDAALLAHVHSETELENKVVQFIKERLQELMETKKWRDFIDTHSELANKILCSVLTTIRRG